MNGERDRERERETERDRERETERDRESTLSCMVFIVDVYLANFANIFRPVLLF